MGWPLGFFATTVHCPVTKTGRKSHRRREWANCRQRGGQGEVGNETGSRREQTSAVHAGKSCLDKAPPHHLAHTTLLTFPAGGSAIVFKCRWPSRFGPRGMLAIKMLQEVHGFQSTSMIEAFQYEADVLSRCR